MKILDVTEFFSERGGGVRSYLTQLAREGAARGHEVVVVAPGAVDAETPLAGGRLVTLAGPRMPYDPSYRALWNVKAIHAVIARERPDVVEASSPYVAALAVASARLANPRASKALVLHSDQIGSYAEPTLGRWLGPVRARRVTRPLWSGLRRLAERFDQTIVAARWFAERLAVEQVPNVVQVPFGIDRARFSPTLRDLALRAELLAPLGAAAADPRARLALIVGRLAHEKRVAFVFEALALAARARPVAVVVLGDGPERARLERQAARLGLAATFLGFVKDPARYAQTLASADVLVHGCAVETFGFSIAEALASGVGVVAPNAGGAGELVDAASGVAYPAQARPAEVGRLLDDVLALAPGHFTAGALARAAQIPEAGIHFERLFALYTGAPR